MSEQAPLQDPLANAFESFRGDALPTFTPPGSDAVRTTVRRRQRTRAAAVAACAVVGVVGAGIALMSVRPPADGLQPAPAKSVSSSPTQSASPSPTPSTSASPPVGSGTQNLRLIDWRNQRVPMTGSPICPDTQVQFRNGEAESGAYRYTLVGTEYGDLDGDGREDAVLHLSCGSGETRKTHLVAVSSAMRGLGAVALGMEVVVDAYSVVGGEIVVTMHPAGSEGSQTRRYRLDGTLKQVGGPTSFAEGPAAPPPSSTDVTAYAWEDSPLDLPFAGSTVTVNPNGQSCPRIRAQFRSGSASGGGCTYEVSTSDVRYGDFNGDGVKDVMLEISAARSQRNSWLFAYTLRNGKPSLIGFVTGTVVANPDPNVANDVETVGRSVNGRQLTVQQFTAVNGTHQMVTRTFSWNGSRFVADKPSPVARTDARP